MRLCNNLPAARKLRLLRRAARLLRSRPGPPSPDGALQDSKAADPHNPEHPRSVLCLLRNQADPRHRVCSRSVVVEQLLLDNGPSRGATASDPATAPVMPHAPQPAGDMVCLDARQIEDHRDMLAERAQPHRRSDQQSDVSTPSKRSRPARSPYRRRLWLKIWQIFCTPRRTKLSATLSKSTAFLPISTRLSITKKRPLWRQTWALSRPRSRKPSRHRCSARRVAFQPTKP